MKAEVVVREDVSAFIPSPAIEVSAVATANTTSTYPVQGMQKHNFQSLLYSSLVRDECLTSPNASDYFNYSGCNQIILCDHFHC